MECNKCGNPLRIIAGGQTTDIGSKIIKHITVLGCLNPDCERKMQEQRRIENIQESFEG